MRRPTAHLETLAFAIVAAALLPVGAFIQPDGMLSKMLPFSASTKAVTVLSGIVIILGALTAIAAVGSAVMIRYRGRTLAGQCIHGARSVAGEFSTTCKRLLLTVHGESVGLWLLAIVCVGIAVRSYSLAQPMRFDEAYTFMNYVDSSPLSAFLYSAPNNHLLHTLLVRISVGVLGDSPPAIRLPAFVAGLLCIPLVFCFTRLLTRNSRSGFLAAAIVSVFPYLVLYDTMARGYSLVVLLALCSSVLGLRLIENPSMATCWALALVTSLGLFTMPTYLCVAAGVACWVSVMLVHAGRQVRWVLSHVTAPYILTTLGFTSLLYAPVVLVTNGVGCLLDNRFVKSLPWHEFWALLPGHIGFTASRFLRDVPTAAVVGALLLFVVGLYTLARAQRWSALTLLPALIIGGFVVLVAKHAIPYDRTWIYLLPFVAMAIDAGIAGASARLPDAYARIAMLLVAVCVAVLTVSHNLVSAYPDCGHFPEAQVLAGVLADTMGPGDGLVAKCPADAPVSYYMRHLSVPRTPELSQPEDSLREFIVVKPSAYSLVDVTKRGARRILKIGDAELHVSGPLGTPDTPEK